MLSERLLSSNMSNVSIKFGVQQVYRVVSSRFFFSLFFFEADNLLG